jgi:hypothetical protein
MRKTLMAGMILFLSASLTYGQAVPKHLTAMHDFFTQKLGYSFHPEIAPPNVLIYVQHKSAIWVDLDRSGDVRSGSVFFWPGHHLTAPYSALSLLYIILQHRMGKSASLLDKRGVHYKGTYLIDTINHNLRIVDKTEFLFDDLVIAAERNPKDQSIAVRLKLRKD